MIKTGSDFSGVGAFDQALSRLGITQNKIFACDMDKYARQTYIYNYGEPAYYPENVYDRAIPEESLDIYMTSPPCQSFSLAGKRKGEDSTNGVLFYNSHEFIVKNNPRYFIFENVKGLLSDNSGKTFKTWIDMLGGKTVNGNPVIFPHEESVPYHVYYQVLNAKHYGVPQNRERVFIIGIRDDADNEFSFPKPFHLVKRLKDVLESEVDEKYFLSDSQISSVQNSKHEHSSRIYEIYNCSPTIMAKSGGGHEPYINTDVKQINPSKESGGVQPFQHNRVYEGDIVGTLDTEYGRPSYVTPQRIRRLTPAECFRLMDFNDDFKWNVSDSQAYKQAGNSIVVNCLVEIISKLKL
jgi:DNA (cytosine-5)-methyltransferase 1